MLYLEEEKICLLSVLLGEEATIAVRSGQGKVPSYFPTPYIWTAPPEGCSCGHQGLSWSFRVLRFYSSEHRCVPPETEPLADLRLGAIKFYCCSHVMRPKPIHLGQGYHSLCTSLPEPSLQRCIRQCFSCLAFPLCRTASQGGLSCKGCGGFNSRHLTCNCSRSQTPAAPVLNRDFPKTVPSCGPRSPIE